MNVNGYTAYVYDTTSGRIVGPSELPLADTPTWNRKINDTGAWSVKVLIGATPTWNAATLLGITVGMRFSVAILWGSYCCQAGPITGYDVDDDSVTVTLSGGGLWALFNRRLLHNKSWNPSAQPITDISADQTLTGQLWDIAAALISNSTSWVNRPGSALPIDIPSQSGTGTNSIAYAGYELVMCGQKLQELTQMDGGPDVDFAPYRVSGTNTIRHRMAIGQPYITQTGGAIVFDYGSSLRSLKIKGDASNLSTSTWVKGSGSERGQLYATATSTTLTGFGWPATDYVDSSYASTSALNSGLLQKYANADLALYGRSIEAWTGVVSANGTSSLGTYDPGFYGSYNVNGHPWLPNGTYSVRILGFGNGPDGTTVTHVLDGRGSF